MFSGLVGLPKESTVADQERFEFVGRWKNDAGNSVDIRADETYTGNLDCKGTEGTWRLDAGQITFTWEAAPDLGCDFYIEDADSISLEGDHRFLER